MKYLVIKQYADGDCYIENPHQRLTIEEATALRDMLRRTDANPDHSYLIFEVTDL